MEVEEEEEDDEEEGEKMNLETCTMAMRYKSGDF